MNKFRLLAMAIKMPDGDGHPNRTPFEGILTKVDEPSDKAPSGSMGHRVLIPSSLARGKLHTLLGMGVGVTPDLEDHDNRFKVGIITEADIVGNDLTVKGYLFAKDFEEEVEAIRAASKADIMGMSFEISDVSVKNPNDDIWVLHDLNFTGAAILKRASAAYETTSLIAAKADQNVKEWKMSTTKKARRAAGEALEELQTVYASLQAMEEKQSDDDDANVQASEKEKDEQKAAAETEDQDAAKAGADPDDEVGSDPKKAAASASEEDLVAAALKALKASSGVENFEDMDQVVAAMKKFTAPDGDDEKQEDQAASADMEAANMKAMLNKMMSMCKAMMKSMGDGFGMDEGEDMDDEGDMGEDMEHEDEDQDMAMLKRLVQKMESYNAAGEKKTNAKAAKDTRLDTLEASVELITDSVKKMTNLLTDSQSTGKKLATDDASRRAEDGKPARKSLAAGGEYEAYLSKYGIDASADYTVEQLDSVLKEAGVTDPSVRIAIKHGLEAQGHLN
jgi:hypothetical protein